MILFKSHYSIGRSILQIDKYNPEKPGDPESGDNITEIAANLGLKNVFFVEDGLYGYIPTYKLMKKQGQNMCFGWRVSIVENALEDEQAESKIVIFTRNELGWKKLIKMASYAQTKGKRKEPRLDWKTLHEHWDENLVLVVPFYDSFIHKNLMTKSVCIPDFRGIQPFFFLEDNDVFIDGMIREGIENYGGRVIEAKTCYYKSRKDVTVFQARKLMEKKGYGGGTMEVPNLELFMSDDFCVEAALEREFKVNQEFESLFDEPLELFLPGIKLPEFKIGEEDRKFYGIPKGASNTEVLRIIARHGYKRLLDDGQIPRQDSKIYGERVNHELDVLEKCGFTDYILLVWSVINHAKKQNFPVGIGRGSSSGSAVCWACNITETNPISEGLLFSRFVNESRTQVIELVPPGKTEKEKYIVGGVADVDSDLAGDAKEACLEFLESAYKGRFCKTATLGTLATKAVTKTVMKIVGGYSEDETKPICGEVEAVFGRTDCAELTYDKSEKYRNFMDENPDVYTTIKKLSGAFKNIGSHASAYLVSADPLDENFPVEISDAGELLSSADMNTTSSICVKLDLLGLHTVSLIGNAAKSAGVDLSKLDYEDPTVYAALDELEHPGWLFQVSGDATWRGLKKIKPKSLSHLVGCISLSRPGAFEHLDTYASFISGESEIPSLHPMFDEALKETGGLCYLQEDLMRLIVMIGFDLVEADSIRRIVSKKDKEEIIKWEEKIYTRAEENGIDKAAAKVVWDLALASADYSFNKCCDPNTIVIDHLGNKKEMKKIKKGERVKAFNQKTQQDHFVEVLDIFHNKRELFEVEFDNENILRCSMDHKILCADMVKRPLREIVKNKTEVVSTSMFRTYVTSVRSLGERDTIDFEVNHPDHNFYGNNIVISNSHAVSYSMMSFKSIFLKTKYPLDFFTEAFNLCKEKGEQIEEIAALARELPHFGIKLLPPDLIKSDVKFKKEDGNIRYGLGSIKSIAGKSIEQIKKFISSEKTNMIEMFQSAKLSKVKSPIFIALVETGCADSLEKNRQSTTLGWRIFCKLTEREQRYCIENGEKYGYKITNAMHDFLNWKDSNQKIFTKESRLATIRRDCESYFEIYYQNTKNPDLSSYLHERTLLGFSTHILRELFNEYPNLHSVQKIKEEFREKDIVKFVAEVLEVHVRVAKKSGNKYLYMVVADETGTQTFQMFGDTWAQFSERNPTPEEGQLLLLQGQKWGETVSGSYITFLKLDVFMRVRDLIKLTKRAEGKEIQEGELVSN